MISINVPNIVTITLIALLGGVAVKYGLSVAGIKPAWL